MRVKAGCLRLRLLASMRRNKDPSSSRARLSRARSGHEMAGIKRSRRGLTLVGGSGKEEQALASVGGAHVQQRVVPSRVPLHTHIPTLLVDRRHGSIALIHECRPHPNAQARLGLHISPDHHFLVVGGEGIGQV